MKNVNAFELTKNKKLFLLDMDGTVYHGDVPIPGAVRFSFIPKATPSE